MIIVENIAVELGISNGSHGTLVGINYSVRNGHRVAVSADVELPNYSNPDSDAQNPHLVTLGAMSTLIKYTKRTSSSVYTAHRTQLPIIGGFSFTIHNWQGCSLNTAFLHLEGCPSIATVYVALSQIKCGFEELVGLKIFYCQYDIETCITGSMLRGKKAQSTGS